MIFNIFKKTPKFSVPTITLPYDQVIKAERRKYLFTFLVLLGLAVFYSYSFTQRKIAELELVPVIVVQNDLTAPNEITADDITLHQLQRKNLPQKYWKNKKEVVGKFVIRDMVKNQVLLPADMAVAIDPNSISTKFEEAFAFNIDEDWFESKLPNIKSNDRIDILAVNPRSDVEGDLVAKNIKIISVTSSQSSGKKRLTLNVTPQEATTILEARAARLTMNILVHSSLPPK